MATSSQASREEHSHPLVVAGVWSQCSDGGCSITGGPVGTPVAAVWSSVSGDGESLGQQASESEDD